MIEAGQTVFIKDVEALGLQLCTILAEALRLDALTVHLYDFDGSIRRNGDQIGCKYLVCGIGYLLCQDICLEEMVCVVQCFKLDIA